MDKKRVLFYIGHPAHFYIFTTIGRMMEKNGHFVFYAVKDKEFTIELCSKAGLEYIKVARVRKIRLSKLLSLIGQIFRLIWIDIRKNPDLYVSHSSVPVSIARKLTGKKHIAIEDTGNMEQVGIALLGIDALLTSTSFTKQLLNDQIFYEGYHELVYLHPKIFKPDPGVLNELGLNPEDKFIIIRFISWKATHELGKKGMSIDSKRLLIKRLKPYGKIFISSESVLEAEFEAYRLKIGPERIHHVLSFAQLVFGESATMASEAAMLGTPAIYLDHKGRDYTDELEKKYGLVFNYFLSDEDQLLAIEKAEELLKQNSMKQKWCEKRNAMLKEKICPAYFMAWFMENYPESKREILRYPDQKFRDFK